MEEYGRLHTGYMEEYGRLYQDFMEGLEATPLLHFLPLFYNILHHFFSFYIYILSLFFFYGSRKHK